MKRFVRFYSSWWIVGAACALLHHGFAAEPSTNAPAVLDDYFVHTWQENEGLPRNTITSIAQTPNGYLWLGTQFGLVRFDGVKFMAYGLDLEPELLRSLVWQLQTDHAGRLWLATGKSGLLVLDRGSMHQLSQPQGLPHPTVYSMREDNNGVMWVSTGDGSISRVVEGTKVDVIGYLRGVKSGVPIQIIRDTHGELWFTQGNSYGRLREGVATNAVRFNSGLVHLCPSKDGGLWMSVNRQLRKIKNGPDSSETPPLRLPFGNYEMQQLFEDRWGNLWIGTRNLGLFRLKDGEVREVLSSKNKILDIFEDAEGSLWVAMEGGGLSKIRPRVFRVLSTPEGVASTKVLSVCTDSNGAVWVAPQVGGLVHYRTPSGPPAVPPDTLNMGLTSVVPDGGGGVWVGTAGRGLLHYDGARVERLFNQPVVRGRQIRGLYPDRKGQLWVGLFPFGLAACVDKNWIWPSYYHDLGVPDQAIAAIAEDREGAIWFGTVTGELHRLKEGKVVTYTLANGLPGAAISALYADTNNVVWIGTLGAGVGCFSGGKFTFASVDKGLHDNVISQIVEDDFGFFWFGSNRGIFRVQKRNLDKFMTGQISRLESIPYGRSDGLANVECNGGYQPSVWKSATGQLFFATSKGAIFFDPAALPLNLAAPPLALERMAVDGKAISNAMAIELNWNHKKLEFEYTALSFIAPEKVHFRRQLVGFDPDWVEDGPIRSATYPRLEPGRYQFRFTACNNDGGWNEKPFTIAIAVTPAWWQRLWCRVLMVIAVVATVAGLVRYYSVLSMRRRLARLEQANAVERERTRIARDIHDDVGARLTQMAFLSDLASTEIAEGVPSGGERLKEIVRASRQTMHALDEIVWAVNPRKDSLAHLVEYISQYANNAFRGTDCRCRQDLPMTLPDWMMSAEFRHHLFLAAKEALNNVRKHSKATEVWIRVKIEGNLLELVVEDNGDGFSIPEVNAGREGLKNIRSRLAALGGRCNISSQSGAGTRLVMTVPLLCSESRPEKEP